MHYTTPKINSRVQIPGRQVEYGVVEAIHGEWFVVRVEGLGVASFTVDELRVIYR
jgi:hypothetical protein